MQGTVHTFEPADGSGQVVLDTGRLVPFGADVLAASGLRLLRLGQRLSLELSGDPESEGVRVTRLWIRGIGPGETIG